MVTSSNSYSITCNLISRIKPTRSSVAVTVPPPFIVRRLNKVPKRSKCSTQLSLPLLVESKSVDLPAPRSQLHHTSGRNPRQHNASYSADSQHKARYLQVAEDNLRYFAQLTADTCHCLIWCFKYSELLCVHERSLQTHLKPRTPRVRGPLSLAPP